MANKYIRHGETYCGDGTSPDAATSNGGVGAWNNINVFEGTAPAYGALAAGDVVYIRSKDASGANMVRTMTADLSVGSAAAVEASPVTWVLDNGVIWPGIDGTLKYQNSGDNYTLTFRNYNNVIAGTRNALSVVTSNTWGTFWKAALFGVGCYIKNFKVDGAAWARDGIGMGAMFSGAVVENLTIVCGVLTGQSGYGLLNNETSVYVKNTLINPEIVINGTPGTTAVLRSESYTGMGQFTILGGRIYGTAANSAAYLVDKDSRGPVRFIGTQIPRTMRLSESQIHPTYHLEIIGCDPDGTGGYLEEYWGWATSRTDNYPPALSATLPGSSLTPWAWRVYPKQAGPATPMQLIAAKLYTDTAAIKTVTQEFLVATTMAAAANRNTVWMTVEYIDNATGLPQHVSTRDFTAPALDVSTANWSATTWGMIAFAKRKLSVQTPTAIKPNTMVTVALFATVKSVTADDVFFVDPDFAVM